MVPAEAFGAGASTSSDALTRACMMERSGYAPMESRAIFPRRLTLTVHVRVVLPTRRDRLGTTVSKTSTFGLPTGILMSAMLRSVSFTGEE